MDSKTRRKLDRLHGNWVREEQKMQKAKLEVAGRQDVMRWIEIEIDKIRREEISRKIKIGRA